MRRLGLALLVLLHAAGCSEERPRLVGPTVGVHAEGFADPASDAFHAHDLAKRNWDLSACAKCHGDDFGGGVSGVSCLSCHQEGPQTCTTCHGTPPATGAHASHDSVTCSTCHQVPERWDDRGHIVGDPAPAEVVLTALGTGGTYATGTCSNIYCHGGQTKTWQAPSAEDVRTR